MNLNRIPHRTRSRPIVTVLATASASAAIALGSLAVAGGGVAADERIATAEAVGRDDADSNVPTRPSTTTPVDTRPGDEGPAAQTKSPTPDELEGPVAEGAGEITTIDPGPAPTPQPAPQLAPTWTEAPLTLVEVPAPSAPSPVDIPPLNGGGTGDLVTNASGCELQCISTAILQENPTSSQLHFDLTTTVDTSGAVWLLDSLPNIVGGVPAMDKWPDALETQWSPSWSTSLDVEPDTTYQVVLRVKDENGHERWALGAYNTSAVPDQLAANGDGCAFQCITSGIAYPTDSYDRVDLVVTTNLGANHDVDFTVDVSTSAPQWVGPNPTLPADEPFVVDQDGTNDISGHVAGLDPETLYHVVVTATDEDGHTAYAHGQFTTDPVPPPNTIDVKVGWERIYVHHDGDPGAWGKGELAFAWGLERSWGNHPNSGLTSYGWTLEEKIGDNTSVPLGGYSHTWIEVVEGDTLPIIAVTAHERDGSGMADIFNCLESRWVTHDVQQYESLCNSRINVAVENGLTIADIEQMQSCADLGIPDKHDHRCLVTKSFHANDDHAAFDAVLSFRVLP